MVSFNMPLRRVLIILILFTGLSIACSNNEKRLPPSQVGYEINIKHRIGDDYLVIRGTDTTSYLNYPFYVGEFRNIKTEKLYCIIVSKNLSNSRRASIEPIGMLEMRENGESLQFVIGIPVQTELRSVLVEDYTDLVTNFMAVKNIIQSWLNNRCGMGCSEITAWHDEQYADFFLDKRK